MEAIDELADVALGKRGTWKRGLLPTGRLVAADPRRSSRIMPRAPPYLTNLRVADETSGWPAILPCRRFPPQFHHNSTDRSYWVAGVKIATMTDLWMTRFERLKSFGFAALLGMLILVGAFLGNAGVIQTVFIVTGLLAIVPGFFYLFAVTIWHWKARYRGITAICGEPCFSSKPRAGSSWSTYSDT